MQIKQILNEIASESSTNEKMNILAKYKDNETLQKVMYLALSKRIKFYIKQIPEYQSDSSNLPLMDALLLLDVLSSRKLTGGDASKYLQVMLTSLSADDAIVIERIIGKDLKIGMGGNINKVIPGLIEETPYMGAKGFNMKLVEKLFQSKTEPVYSQIKMDGRYCNAIIRDGEVETESRNGEPTVLTGSKLLNELANFDDCVLNGELTIKSVPRYISNGIIASLVSIGKKQKEGKDTKVEIRAFELEHDMEYQSALDSITFTVWDTITIDEYFDAKSNTPYFVRLETANHLIQQSKSTVVQIIEYKLVRTIEEAIQHFQEMLNKGEEGTIVKSYAGGWKDGKPNHQVKFKKEITLDLKIVDFKYGKKGTKNEFVIASVHVESEDRLLRTCPGGINESTMQWITDNQESLLGQIVEVKCNGVSQDSNGNYSLLHPRYIKMRDDKSIGNTLAECIEINESSQFL